MAKTDYTKVATRILAVKADIPLAGIDGRILRKIIATNPSAFVNACVELGYYVLPLPHGRYPRWLKPIIEESKIYAHKIQAIKKLRELKGMSLLGAKCVVEMLAEEEGKEWIGEVRALLINGKQDEAIAECIRRDYVGQKAYDLIDALKITLS